MEPNGYPNGKSGWDPPPIERGRGAAPSLPERILKGTREISGPGGYYDPDALWGRARSLPYETPALTPATQEARATAGGWLLVFCVARVILAPLWMAALAFVEWRELMSIYSLQLGILDRHPGLVFGAFAEIGIGAAVTAYGVYAGVRLWRALPDGVRLAKRSIVLSMAFAGIQVLLPLLADLPSDLTKQRIVEKAATSVLVCLGLSAWYVYFARSKRVAQTFPTGRELAERIQGLGL